MKLISAEQYRGKKICVALSGGADSVCLLHAFFSCAAEYGITLTALHIEHGIRGEESLRDMRFCESLCKAWGIPLKVISVDVPAVAQNEGIGLEEAGRAVRYAAFRAELEGGACDFVATAHHKNDVAETVLFRLARGTALSGMRAVTERQGIIRPLLSVWRTQIEEYLRENDLPHVEDSTNSDEGFARNYIRQTVLPAFEAISSGAAEHLVRFASLAAADDDYLYTLARREITEFEGDSYVPADLPDPLFSRACLLCMEARDYTGANLSEIAKLKTLQSGKKVCLPHGQEVAREYDHIVFYTPEPQNRADAPFTPAYGMYSDAGFAWAVNAKKGVGRALRADLDCFPAGCVVRTRREGDFITPFGGNTKTLKKFLTEKKISARLGRKLRLIACGSEILAVLGVEISDKVKVTETAKRVGYLL